MVAYCHQRHGRCTQHGPGAWHATAMLSLLRDGYKEPLSPARSCEQMVCGAFGPELDR